MIERFKIKEEELIVIVPPQCRFASAQVIEDFSAFRNEPFIVNSRSNTGTNYVFNRMCEEAGFKPNIAFESNDDHTMIGMVASGLGIAVVADSPSLLTNKVAPLYFARASGEKSVHGIQPGAGYFSAGEKLYRVYPGGGACLCKMRVGTVSRFQI